MLLILINIEYILIIIGGNSLNNYGISPNRELHTPLRNICLRETNYDQIKLRYYLNDNKKRMTYD